MGTMVRDAMMRIEREIECFGLTKDLMQTQLQGALEWQNHKQIAMSLMSDAQEEIERGLLNKARQSLNRAKWVLCQTEVK